MSLLDDQQIVLDQLIDIGRDQKIEAVLIAGDIFDRSVPPAHAVELLDDVIHRMLSDLKVPIIAITGNHDSPQRLSFASRQLAASQLHIMGKPSSEPQSVALEDKSGKVIVYGIPYTTPNAVRLNLNVDVTSHDEMIAYFADQIAASHPPQHRSVLMGHLFLDGAEESESERPLSVGGLESVSPKQLSAFNYAALGHLHRPQWKSKASIRYSGSILKYSFSEHETGKSVSIVDIDQEGQCQIEQISLRPRRDVRVIEGKFQKVLEQGASDPARDDYLLVRLSDKDAILDIMNRLREVYPNVLHVERPGLMSRNEHYTLRKDLLKRSELSMFSDFYNQVTSEELEAEQREYLEKLLETIHKEEEPG